MQMQEDLLALGYCCWVVEEEIDSDLDNV